MATSLAQQLQKLQPTARLVPLGKNGLPSVLFEPREAAEYDIDTIHALSVNGLVELARVDRV